MGILIGLGRHSLGYTPRSGIIEPQSKHTFYCNRKGKITFQDDLTIYIPENSV